MNLMPNEGTIKDFFQIWWW